MKKLGFMQPTMLTSLKKFDEKFWMLCTNTKGLVFFPIVAAEDRACLKI